MMGDRQIARVHTMRDVPDKALEYVRLTDAAGDDGEEARQVVVVSLSAPPLLR